MRFGRESNKTNNFFKFSMNIDFILALIQQLDLMKSLRQVTEYFSSD